MNDTSTNDTSTNDTSARTTGSSRRSATIGVAAGLLAGGAIGLAATVPSLTNAASDDSGDVVLQDDTDETTDEATDEATDETTDETTDEATDEATEPGGRLREMLQPLVDDGTITASQADAVTTHLAEHRPERGDRVGRLGGRGLDGHGRNHTVLADILGIDRETLRTELAAGNSIADIAEASGVEVQAVIDALVADAESHFDLAVEHGLDEERAATRLERITERIEERVYDTRDTDR